jgi:hypothetical protein
MIFTLDVCISRGGMVECEYSSAPVPTGNTFQDLPRLREKADNTEPYT